MLTLPVFRKFIAFCHQVNDHYFIGDRSSLTVSFKFIFSGVCSHCVFIAMCVLYACILFLTWVKPKAVAVVLFFFLRWNINSEVMEVINKSSNSEFVVIEARHTHEKNSFGRRWPFNRKLKNKQMIFVHFLLLLLLLLLLAFHSISGGVSNTFID